MCVGVFTHTHVHSAASASTCVVLGAGVSQQSGTRCVSGSNVHRYSKRPHMAAKPTIVGFSSARRPSSPRALRPLPHPALPTSRHDCTPRAMVAQVGAHHRGLARPSSGRSLMPVESPRGTLDWSKPRWHEFGRGSGIRHLAAYCMLNCATCLQSAGAPFKSFVKAGNSGKMGAWKTQRPPNITTVTALLV